MKRNQFPCHRLASLGLLVLAAAGPMSARAEGDPSAASDETQLQSIIITAQKRTEDIIKVPISAMAMDQQELDQLGVKDISDIARIVPGLTFQPIDDAGDNNIAIRGIISSVGAATTGIYIDDVPVMIRQDSGIGSNPYPKIFDLDRMEVLRGPQGTLFGAGAEGGVVRFITPEAGLHKFSGYASTDIADTVHGDPSYEAGVAVGGPISEGTLGYRFSAWHRVDGGFGDRVDPATDQVLAHRDNSTEATVAHLSLKLAPTTDFSITPSVFYQLTHNGDTGLFLESAGTYNSSSLIAQPHDDRFLLSTLNLDYDFGGFTFKSISSYIDRKVDQLYDGTGYELGSILANGSVTVPFDPNYLVVAHFHSVQEGVTQEFRFTSTDQPADRWSWVTGVFYRTSSTSIESLYQDPNFNNLSAWLANPSNLHPIGTPADSVAWWGEAPVDGIYSYTDYYPLTETDLAAFGDVTYRFTPALKFAVGLRVARASFSYRDYENGPWGPAEPFFEQGSQSETPLTPRFNLTYDIDQQRMVYASIAKGYRIGGANEPVPVGTAGGCGADLAQLGLTQVPQTYKSDSLWSYEIGSKGRFLDRRLLLEASAYWINWSQIQQSVALVQCGYNYIANLGNAVSRGLDMQAEWVATKHVVFDATAGWTDAFYSRTLVQDGQLLTKAGDKLATPLVTVTVGTEYRFTPWENASGYARLDYDFNGAYKRYGSIDTFGNYPYANDAPPVRYLAARIGSKFGRWEVSAYGNNLVNESTSLFRYYTFQSGTVNSTDFKDVRMRPLTAGVSAKYSF